nr:CotH kinase family protein [Bacteroidota bacterium]
NFNAEYEDKSYIRAFLSSRVFRMSGQHCFDTDFARLYLNGDFLGLYQLTENMDGQFLEANGINPSGNLYKATKDGACLSVYDDLTNFWEQKTGSGNKEDLALFINQINHVSDGEYLGFCQDQMDYGQMINIIATNMILSNQSTYYHNYYMFHDVNQTGKWGMMPWDLDKTFSVYAWKNYTNSSAPWVPDNPLLERALLNETIFADIRNRVSVLGEEALTSSVLFPMIDSLVQALQASVEQDTTDDIENVQEWLDQVNVEKGYIGNWPSQIQGQFNHVQSTFVAVRTPLPQTPDVTFIWTPSIDPDGQPIEYKLLITSGFQFEPELTSIYDGIITNNFTVNDIPEGDYFWKVISVSNELQEVEAFDSKNPLTIKIFETLPCTITENLELTSEFSPYLVDCNVTVEPQAILTVHEGVTVLFENNTYLKINGGFQVSGTRNNPVCFMPSEIGGTFDSLVFVNPQSPISISYLNMTDGSIHANSANIVLDHCKLKLQNKNLVGQNVIFGHYYGNVVFKNSEIIGNNSGQGLEFGWCQSAIIENCTFRDIDDPMEFISVNEGYVHYNYAWNSNDDGIDFNNCKNLSIIGNRIFHCIDKGITIGNEFNGPCENILISGNLIVDCTTGITVKDGSSAEITGNTFFQNGTGIKIWEKNAGLGGSQALVVNSIISSTTGDAIYVDDLSQAQVSYSLCDTEVLEGTGNLFDNPHFESVPDTNFMLQLSSPCINTGDPASPPDPDGTRADMGAFFYNFGNYNVVLNEINYKSSPDFYTEDWVELYNVETFSADISGWIFKDEDNSHIFEFPYGTVIPSQGYLVLCSDCGLFSEKNPDIENYTGSFPFGLSS